MTDKPITESRQIMRVSRVLESDGEKLHAVISDPYGNLPAWQETFVTMARSVVRAFYPDATEEEKEFNANVLLRKSAMSMKIDRVARQITDPLKMHPGEAPILDAVLEDDKAVQAISVWISPPEPCPDCIEHEGRTFISGDASVIATPADLGTILAGVAFQHALLHAKNDPVLEHKIVTEVMEAFIARFDVGKTRH